MRVRILDCPRITPGFRIAEDHFIQSRVEPEGKMENTEYFVGWGTLTLINAGLAQAKGRSGLLWWLISLFLGPIATFLVVLLPSIIL